MSSLLGVTGSASSGLEPGGYTIHNRVYYYSGPCIFCWEHHGNDTPCRETEYKKYWERHGEQVKVLLSHTDA